MKYTKTIPTIILATLIILGTISPMLFTATPKTLAQGSITVSSDYFNPYKAIMVEVRGDYGPNITVLITNDLTGDTLNLSNVPRVAPNYYVFYLGGPEADVEYPISGAPTIRIDENVDKGTPIRIDVLGAALTYVVRYDVVKPTVTLDRREYPYRRNATIVISYIDEDADHDPTARDELLPGNVGVDITLIKADGTVVSETTDLEELGAVPSREALVRGGRFEFTITISKINDVLAGAYVGKDDRVLLSFYTKGDAQGGDEWMDEKTTVDFKAVYKYPSVSITFNYQSLTIDVTSPDDNVDSRVKDTLDPEAKVTLEVGGKYCDISAEDFREIGVNANTFRMTFRVVWGTDYKIDCVTKTVTLPSNTDGPFTATARYYKMDPRPGYSIDATGAGIYTPTLPKITVEKASLKLIVATVAKPDLNNDPNSIEFLRGTENMTESRFDIGMSKDDVRLARLRILDKGGALVAFTGSPGEVTMVETDFNSGVFTLKIPAEKLGIKAGESYTLEYVDFAGFKGRAVTVSFKVAEIALTLDRAEYPAAFGENITVYVTYSNDLHNKDPTRRETVDVSYTILAFNGTTLGNGTVILEETDVDTGLFKGKSKITVPNDDRVIGGKLVVSDPGRASVEATFKLYDGRLAVSPSTIRIGGVVTVTVEDPDGNRDSGAINEINLTVRSERCAPFQVTLRETGVNTGVFRDSIRWDRVLTQCAAAPDRITFEYVDVRARELLTGFTRYTVTLRAVVTLASTSGTVRVVSAEAGKVSITETFDIVVEDQDENLRHDEVNSFVVYVFIEGVHTVSPVRITLQETGVNTGVFKWTGRLSNIPEVPTDPKDLPKLIGRNILITYLDAADARGERAVAQAVATIVAYDPELRLSPEVAVNIGDVLTITVVDKNRVGTGTVNVMVKSTVYPIPVTYSASEKIVDGRGTGIFEAKIRAVGVAEWYPDYPEPSIPVKFGDVIEVIYVAPVNSKGETNTILTKSVAVGIRPAIPGETRKVEILSELGEPVRPRVGALSFITVTVANVDVVAHNMTVLVVVRDPKGVAVALYFATLSLAPGASQPTGFGWTPTTLGSHTIEVYVVRSLADRTPMARPYTVSVAVA